MFESLKQQFSHNLSSVMAATTPVHSWVRYSTTTVLPAVGLGVALTGFIGCQGFNRTEVFQDRIDRFADHEPHLDHLYRPGYDVSRIGQLDWYEDSAINQRWYDPCKVRELRPLPGYEHNPIRHHEPMEPRPIYRESLTLKKASNQPPLQLANREAIEAEIDGRTLQVAAADPVESEPESVIPAVPANVQNTSLQNVKTANSLESSDVSRATQISHEQPAQDQRSHGESSPTRAIQEHTPEFDAPAADSVAESVAKPASNPFEVFQMEPEPAKEATISTKTSSDDMFDDVWQSVDPNHPTPPLPPKPKAVVKALQPTRQQTQVANPFESNEMPIPAQPTRAPIEEDGFVSQPNSN